MSKYIKIEDAITKLDEWFCEPYTPTELLSDLPTIDIVRCKDCKHRYVTGVTTQYYVCDFMDAEYKDDGYCHRGERTDNE